MQSQLPFVGKMSKPLYTALMKNQDAFNMRFNVARRAKPRIDADAFKEHLRTTVGPIVDAVHVTRPDRVDEVVDVLYDLSLQLLGSQFLGPTSRYPEIAYGWKNVLPELPHLVAESPRKFTGAVTNALYNLSVAKVPSYMMWTTTFVEIGRRVSNVTTALEAGKVAAWRAGLAHYREGALQALLRLAPDVALLALGIDNGVNLPVGTVYERLREDPWLHPAALSKQSDAPLRLQIVARIGAFRGFGGTFMRPPIVFTSGRRFHLTDADSCWVLCADVFGCTLQQTAAPANPESHAAGPLKVSEDGTVTNGEQSQRFPELAGVKSYAENGHTLIVTRELSHTVYVVALQH